MQCDLEPEQTPHGPAYEGRLLDRADEEVVDQGLRFDLGTLLSRRGVLGVLGAGAGAIVVAACSPSSSPATPTTSATSPSPSPTPSSSTTATPSTSPVDPLPAGEIPQEMAGPFPGDGSNGPDVLERSGIVRSDIRSSLGGGATATGVPLAFDITLTDMANGDAPFAGAAVYAWHCDAVGGYSLYSDGIEGESYLRGVQVADANGRVSFTSIFPGCYPGRWPHIHFEVYPDLASTSDSTNAISTTQLALTEESSVAVYASGGYGDSTRNLAGVTLDDDLIFREDRAALQMATTTGSTSTGYTASLVARVDSRTPVGRAARSR